MGSYWGAAGQKTELPLVTGSWVREFIKQTERLGSVKGSQRTKGPHHLSSLVNGVVVNFVWCLIACRAPFMLEKQCSCYNKTLSSSMWLFSFCSDMDFSFSFDQICRSLKLEFIVLVWVVSFVWHPLIFGFTLTRKEPKIDRQGKINQ